MNSQQTSLRYFFNEIPSDGESDKPPLDPDHKPQTGLNFFYNHVVPPGKGNIQYVSNKETSICKYFTTNCLYLIEKTFHPLESFHNKISLSYRRD